MQRRIQQTNRGRLARFILPVLVLLTLPAFAGRPDVRISTDRSAIFYGESCSLTIKVSDYKPGMDPDLSDIPGCSVTFQGSQDNSFQSIVNGRLVEGFSGRVFRYQLTPKATGTLRIAPIKIRKGNKTYTFSGPTIQVQGIEKQDFVLLSIEPSDTRVIVDQPFTVDLKIFIKKLPPPNRDASPISARNPPHLEIPWLDDNAFDGLEGPDIQKLMQAMVVSNQRAPAFTVNNFSMQSFFNMGEAARFDFSPFDTTINGKQYREYRLTMRYIPTAEGSYSFGPASFKGSIFVGVTPRGRGITKTIYAVAPAKTVSVVPPPEENRPTSYIGAIGTNLTVKASLDSHTCRVGDPLTLTLEISGNIRLKNILPPKLSLQQNLTRDFRVYDDSVKSKTVDDKRIYQYIIRPDREGTLELPPIEVSFYNPKTGKYETVKSAVIPLRALPASEFDASTVINTQPQSVSINASSGLHELEIPAPVDMSQNMTAVTRIFVPRLHLPILLTGPLLLMLYYLFSIIHRRLPEVSNRQRRRNAASKAITAIKAAAKAPAPATALADALRDYAANRLDLNAASLTPAELAKILKQKGVEASTANDFVNLLERSFNATFQGATSDSTVDTATAIKTLKRLEDELCKID